MARVVFRRQARADFDSIFDYIALDNPDRALSFVDELERAAEGLADHPNKAPLDPEAGADVRRLTHGADYGDSAFNSSIKCTVTIIPSTGATYYSWQQKLKRHDDP